MLYDYHTHTRFSDGRGEPGDYARAALAAGFAEIACTDHAPFPEVRSNWHMKLEDLPAYVESVEQAKREATGVKMLLGLELDYIPELQAHYRAICKRYDWDFLLGSVHYIGDWNIDNPDFIEQWRTCDVDAVWEAYFKLQTDAVRTGLYNSMAHPDLAKKFGYYPKKDPRPWVEQFLRACAGSDVAIEVSTAGLRRPCKEIYPSLEMLKLARSLGVAITFGSDAHITRDIGRDFDKAFALAKAVGYTEFARFEKRKRSFEPIP